MAAGVNDAACRTMALPMVYAITLAVAIGTAGGLLVVKRRLQKEGWSLANALSEPTRLTLPVESRWTDADGDGLTINSKDTASRKVLRDANGRPLAVTMLEASSSRMIATLGGLGILMLYMGFGTFALYSFGLTCQLPASMTAVTTFLVSGLSLFAPYVANKVSTAIQPRLRSGTPDDQAASSATAAAAATTATTGAEPAHPPPAITPRSTASPAVAPQGVAPAAVAPQAFAPPVVTPQAAGSTTAPAYRSTESGSHPGRPVPSAPRSTSVRGGGAAQASDVPRGDAPSAIAPALDLIRTFEGFVDHAYPDPASGGEPWTIGYGFTTLAGVPVQPGQTIDRAQAEAELVRQVEALSRHLAATIPHWVEMNRNQRCALLDFAWNLGANFYGDTANFATISRDLNSRDWDQVPEAFLLYCDPGTAVEAGLRRRRQAEGNLWCRPEGSTATETAAPIAPAAPPAATTGSKLLRVPYADQLAMADGQGWRECFSASSAMLAMYWGKEPNENVYDSVRARYGDSTSSEAQLAALRSLGLKADFRTDGTPPMLKEEIDAGRPVAVGWLCDGPFSAPTGGGHWSVIIGYDATGFFINDPYGNCDLLNGGYLSHHDGAGLHYSFLHWLPRWQVAGTNGWLLTCRL